MKQQQNNQWRRMLVSAILSGVSILSMSAQEADGPKGLYKLNEIVQQDGKHVEANFQQYKYCLDNYTLMFNYYNVPDKGAHTFNIGISNPDGKPLTYTGELSKTENKGIQTFATSDSTFTLRWFNDRSDFDPHLFPFQTNIDEYYEQVRDSDDIIQRTMNMLQMKLGTKVHRLHGVWKLRGHQKSNTARSQYWIVKEQQERYVIFGHDMAVLVFPNPSFPQGSLNCISMSCNYLSDNVVDCDGNNMILHWLDGETVSVTSIDNNGRPCVMIWDRCGLPQNIQEVFGTEVPQMSKDISRFMVEGFLEKYGKQPDSICWAFETFDYAVDVNERNNAIFPILMRNGFADEYKAMKDSMLSRLMAGEINADEAVGRYVFWFYKNFDRHTNCSSKYFWKLASDVHVNYHKVMTKYAPEPVGCKVDDKTYLLRLPSCMGVVPTWEWLQKKADEFKSSGCKNLILDLRGNGGGSDRYSLMFTLFMGSAGAIEEERSYYRCGLDNNNNLKKVYWNKAFLAQIDSIDDGSFVDWWIVKKGEQVYEPKVHKAAIIIDNGTASAGETPVRFVQNRAKCRAKVYGKDGTHGCEWSGNCNEVRLPHSNITLRYPMTVDANLDAHCKERNPSLKPDVIIPLPYPEQLTDNIDSWVLWVAKKM